MRDSKLNSTCSSQEPRLSDPQGATQQQVRPLPNETPPSTPQLQEGAGLKRLVQYGKELSAIHQGGTNNSRNSETLGGRMFILVVCSGKIDRFSFANPSKARRNCHLPGRSLAEQLPPTLFVSGGQSEWR